MKAFKVVITFILLPFIAFALSEEEIKKAYYQSYNFEKIQRYDEAIKALMPVYNAYPDGYTVNLRLGWLYYLKGNFSNSVYHYSKAIKVAPYSIEAKLGLTLPLMAQKKLKEVEEVVYQILKTDYYNYYGNLRLVLSLKWQRKYEQAKKVALKMLYIYPTDVNFLQELGEIELLSGNKEKARKILKDVLILDPLNVKAKSLLEKIKD